MSNLSLNDVVNVIVNLNPKSALRKGFNLGLIIGTSDVISVEDRVKVYSSLEAMMEDGFKETHEEYIAAQKYFSPMKKPTRIAIGRWSKAELDNNINEKEDLEEDKLLENKFKSGYKETKEKLKKSLESRVDLAAETVTEAITKCRQKNTDWYAAYVCGASDKEIEDLAGYIESASPSSMLLYVTSSDDVLNAKEGNIMEILKKKMYKRTMGQYSTTKDSIVSIMGYAMGANTRTNNSVFTLMFKDEIGVVPEDLSDNQVSNLQKNNGNYYISRGPAGDYNMFEQGVLADGTYFDEMLNLDMLVNDMQLAIVDRLKQRGKIPQTEAGMNDIKLAITPVLKGMVTTGFIAPGIWNGPAILGLETGDMLDLGYRIMSEPIDSQSQSDRDQRKAPAIYTPVKLAGSIHYVMVQIDVNR